MRASEARRSRQRIDTKAVRDQAVRGSNRGSHTLQLPDGIREWRPEKEGEYELRILPYLVSLAGHPDDREVGSLWYRRPFRVHFSVGGSDKAVVCPKSFGKPCPICQEIDLLYKDGYERNKKVIDSIKATRMCLFAAYVNDEKDMVVFAWNESKFAEKLEKELKKTKPENLGFADTEEGRLLVIRTDMEEPGTKEFKAYLTTDRIDFADAGDLTQLSDEILDSVPQLDEVLKQLPFEQIAKMFHGVEDEEEGEQAAQEEASAPKPTPPAATRAAPAAKPAPVVAPKEEEQPKPPKAQEPAGDEACVACKGLGKNSRGRICAACGGTGLRQEPTEVAPPAATRAAPAAKPAPAPAAAEPLSNDEW